MKDKGFIITFIIYIILFIADLTTTFLNGELVEHLEINPLFLLTKSFIPIIIINAIVMLMLVWTYKSKKATPTGRFLTINSMLSVILLRIIAIRNAIYWLNNPITIEAAKTITTEVKIQAVKQFTIIAYAPIFII